MRNDRSAEKDEETHQLQRLQQQIDDLSIRTARLEEHYTEHATPTPSRQATVNRRYNPIVGDYVHFKPTKITKGGTGRVVRIVRNFVIIQRSSGELVQRAPKNVTPVCKSPNADDGE